LSSINSHILVEKIPHSTQPTSPITVCCEHLGRFCWRPSHRAVRFAYALKYINSLPVVSAHFTVKTGQIVCVRSRNFFLERFLNLEFEKKQKRIWCDETDVFFKKRIAYCLPNVTNFLYFSTASYLGHFRPSSG
jgi:hypothetical protein